LAAQTAAAQEEAQKPDDYVAQLIKFIPSEIVSFYIAIFVAAGAVTGITSGTYWIMFVMGLVATLVFTLANNKRELMANQIPGVFSKTIISTIAFFVWAFTLGAPFTSLSWYHPFYGTMLLMFYTLLAPKLYELVS
jgi:uncharacterized membrane protein YeiH